MPDRSISGKISSALSLAGATAASLLKVALRSRRPSSSQNLTPERPLVILGNGPSLTDLTEGHQDWLEGKDLLAVNFAASSPLFDKLRPSLYVMADPVFFHPETNDKVKALWERLAATDWPMTLLVPASSRRLARHLIPDGSSISLRFFNMTPAEGFPQVIYPLYRSGLAMPRPRNVLIPSIMEAMRLGYKEIYLAGADHSWSQTLWVDDSNRVISVQPHFYPDDEKERERVASLYAGIRLHEIYQSFAIAFRSYHLIERYARRRGVRIVNITPGSFIDAFPRLELPSGR